MNKRNKTRNVLLSLSEEEKNNIGLEVERLIKNEMSYIVNSYVKKYKHATAETFGWETDDLMQHIRIILWKGVATFKPEMNFKITTYLSKMLYYQMGNLSKTCQSEKNSQTKLFFPGELFESEEIIDFNSAEDWALYARKFKHVLTKLSKKDMKIIVCHLVYGFSIQEIEQKTNFSKQEIVSSIKRIKEKMEQNL